MSNLRDAHRARQDTKPQKRLRIRANRRGLQIRLLRCSRDPTLRTFQYRLESVTLQDLPSTHCVALSYTWGQAAAPGDVQQIQIGGQPFFVRRNLYDILRAAAAKDAQGLFFVDAICINQSAVAERQLQVPEMARVSRQADEVIAWLGAPNALQADGVRALSQTRGKDCAAWTARQWEGFRYLSYNAYWSRVWVVQEVLLASNMSVCCGFFTFPLSLFAGPSGIAPPVRTKFSGDGRPRTVVDASLRLRSPAERIVTHRTRQVLRRCRDTPAQGTEVGTLEEMSEALRRPCTVIETYQSPVMDPLYEVVRKLGKPECFDPRDKLYGFLGILDERARAQVVLDYTRDVSFAYRQALKIGLQEIYREHVGLTHPARADGAYLGYYCDARDAFGMDDEESLSILRDVLRELRLRSHLIDAMLEVQWQQ